MKTRARKRKPLDLESLEKRELLAVDGFASFDGVGNNEEDVNLGAAGEQFIRIAPSAYADGLSEPARLDQANARDISNILSAQDESVINDRFITSMWFQWGQFLDHDISRDFVVAPEQGTPTESLDISEDFPFNRTPYDPDTGTTDAREHLNRITAFIDGSVVYGSSESRAMSLRTLEGGRMRSTDSAVGELLPFNTTGLTNVPAPIPNFFVAGDVRSNENIGLTSMQTLWVREHNRLAGEIAANDFASEDLTDAEIDEEIFQRARQIVMGLIQNITYNEFLPSTLGFNAIPTYSGYDPSVNPQLSNGFAAAVYRIGHTTLSNELLIGSEGESIPLAEAFFQPGVVVEHGIDPILEGLTLQQMEEVDALIVDAVRNFLDDGPGFDLAAINIQRGRDRGLPDFNTMRQAIGLNRIDSFSQLTSNQELAGMFEDVYGSPDNADPWIAMIAEDHVPGTMVGETIYAYMVDQFTRLRDGDRFYFENALEEDLAGEIKATRLSDVIERNTDLDVQDEVFWTRDTLVFRNGLDNEWLIRDFGENGGAEVVFFGEPGIRDRNNRTETAPVQRDEPINAVIIAGTNELGDGFFIPNALVSSPLADEGIDEFIITADIEFFEGYGLGGNDIWVFESNIQSVFASGDDGRDVLESRINLPGSEVALTGGDGRDAITIRAPQAESVVATGGEGRDRIRVSAPGADSVFTSGGGDDDRVIVDARGADSVRVAGDRGNDALLVRADAVDALFVSGGAGNDRISLHARQAQTVRVNGGGGNDRIRADVSGTENVAARGGDGDDNLRIRARNVDTLFVSGDDGRDRLDIDARGATVAEILGGNGPDSIRVTASRDTELDVDGGPDRDQIMVFMDRLRRDRQRANERPQPERREEREPPNDRPTDDDDETGPGNDGPGNDGPGNDGPGNDGPADPPNDPRPPR
jgi:peroxidase